AAIAFRTGRAVFADDAGRPLFSSIAAVAFGTRRAVFAHDAGRSLFSSIAAIASLTGRSRPTLESILAGGTDGADHSQVACRTGGDARARGRPRSPPALEGPAP